MQRGDVVPPGGILFGDGGVHIEYGRFAEDVQLAGDFGTPLGGVVRAGGDADTLSLQVELLDELAHVQVEVRLVLLHLRMDEVAVGACHAHLSLAAPPVQDGEADAEADILLVQRVAVGVFQLVGGLRQAEAQVDVRLQSGIGFGACHGTFALHLAAQHVLDVGAVLVGKQQGGVQVDVQVGHFAANLHLQVQVLLDAEVRAKLLHAVLHFDAGVHPVGLFGQLVQFQLQHLVLADGADVVASLRIYI